LLWYYLLDAQDDNQASGNDPKRLRDHLGLEPKSNVDFELLDDGRVVLQPDREAPQNRFVRLRGSAKAGLNKTCSGIAGDSPQGWYCVRVHTDLSLAAIVSPEIGPSGRK
jgi:hypothetical protein